MKLRIAVLIAALVMVSSALAQTKPRLTALGGEPAESVLWVGNSFFTTTTACTATWASS